MKHEQGNDIYLVVSIGNLDELVDLDDEVPRTFDTEKGALVVTMSIYQEVLGRFISRAEALRIAREILDRAERERLDIAEYEAARGVQWENHP